MKKCLNSWFIMTASLHSSLVNAFIDLHNGGCPPLCKFQENLENIKGLISWQLNMGAWSQLRISVSPRVPLYCQSFEKIWKLSLPTLLSELFACRSCNSSTDYKAEFDQQVSCLEQGKFEIADFDSQMSYCLCNDSHQWVKKWFLVRWNHHVRHQNVLVTTMHVTHFQQISYFMHSEQHSPFRAHVAHSASNNYYVCVYMCVWVCVCVCTVCAHVCMSLCVSTCISTGIVWW